jgi:hypothetical protein
MQFSNSPASLYDDLEPHVNATFRWLCLLALVGLVAGCSRGPKTIPVTGTVKLDGKPVTGATVRFSDPSVKQTPVGTTDAQGKFTLAYMNKPGAPAGNYKVSISKPAEGAEGGATEIFPARYNAKTKLTAVVETGGQNDFPFDLTSEKDELDTQTPAPAPQVDSSDDERP